MIADLSTAQIQAGLNTQIFGQTLQVYSQIDSTNTTLKALADQGWPEGTLLLADEQLTGRGRFQRRWLAPPGTCLLTSLLFRPTFLPPLQTQHLTMLCALAMLDAIAAQTNIQVALKWPNDLIYQTRKLGGVLTEASFAGTELAWVVVGLGLNVNVDFAAMPLDEVEQAISLQMILGQSLSRRDLLQAYLQAVEQHYQALQAGQTPFAAWRSKLVTLGRAVMVSGGGEMFAGIAEDVDEAGALLVRKSDGTLQRVLAGDVSLRVHSVS